MRCGKAIDGVAIGEKAIGGRAIGERGGGEGIIENWELGIEKGNGACRMLSIAIGGYYAGFGC